MIAATDIQRVVITALQADTATIAYLDASSDIKEDFYRGTVYGMPAIRLDVDRVEPFQNNCTNMFITRFTVIAFSESDSSDTCARMQKAVVEALYAKRISVVSVAKLGPIWLRSNPAPIYVIGERDEQRAWRADSVFECIAIEG